MSLSLGNFCLPIVRIKILLAGYPLYPKAVAGRGRVEWHVPSICHEEIIGYDQRKISHPPPSPLDTCVDLFLGNPTNTRSYDCVLNSNFMASFSQNFPKLLRLPLL